MQIEKLIKKHIQVWDSKVMAIPYASKQYKEHLKQFIDGLVAREEAELERENSEITEDTEGNGFIGYTQGKLEAIRHLKEIRKQLE